MHRYPRMLVASIAEAHCLVKIMFLLHSNHVEFAVEFQHQWLSHVATLYRAVGIHSEETEKTLIS